MREFLCVDDMAEASLFVLELDEEIYQANTKPMLSHINVGTGKDVTIREMAETMKRVVGFKGELKFEESKLKDPISEPCDDSHPAQGCPVSLAVNLATLLEVLIPLAYGLFIISKFGLSSFSKTTQLQ